MSAVPHTPAPLPCRLSVLLEEWKATEELFKARQNFDASCATAACAERLKEVVAEWFADVRAGRGPSVEAVSIPQRKIGDIGNYYGNLEIKAEQGKFYWSIENYTGHDWEEIPRALFDELSRYQDDLEAEGGAL